MSQSQDEPTKTLHTIFHEGLDLYNKVSNTQQATNNADVQRDIKKAIQILEETTRLVSLADIFSTNEIIDELPTNNIQYLLLPALLGSLTLKITSRDRGEVIKVGEVYYHDFLQRTNNYGLSNYQFNENTDKDGEQAAKTELDKLADAVNTRADKIQKYQQHQNLRTQLETLKKNVENEHADEEIKRDYFLTMVKVFIHDVIEEMSLINMEKPLLEYRASIKNDERPKPKREPPPPLKPIIITRDETQKAVYGAGYPSLPTMTVQEFYDKRVADGIFPDPSKPVKTDEMSLQQAALAGVSLNDSDREEEDLENKIEGDDDEYIQRMRAMDEYKDEHRRGWGNRMNRS